jgi:Domain of unknown function (DUF5664)
VLHMATESGVKHDAGKPDWSLFPWLGARAIQRVIDFGAAKYTPGGWQSVPNGVPRYRAALLRHVIAYASGEANDPESGHSHLAHAGCCILFILSLEGA